MRPPPRTSGVGGPMEASVERLSAQVEFVDEDPEPCRDEGQW